MQTHLSSPALPLQLLASKYRTSKHQTERRMRDIIRRLIAFKKREEGEEKEGEVGEEGEEKEEGGEEGEGELARLLREGRGELLELKRELSATSLEQSKLYDICKKRIHRHEELSKDESGREEFSFNAEIIQYLHGCQEMERAKKFEKAVGEEDSFGLESDLLASLLGIGYQIEKNELEGLKRWMFENGHMLTKMESSLEFDLVCCEYINLVLAGELVPACMLLRNKLGSMKLTNPQKKAVQKLTLFLVVMDIQQPYLKGYLNALRTSFISSACQIYGVSFQSVLQRHLSLGISALKSICCSKEQLRNQELCPICTPLPNLLAKSIPQLTKSVSSLKCRINQSIMDEVNYPVALPNGHVYSISGLRDTLAEGGYYCQVTQTVYAKGLAKKVFLA